MWGNGNAVDQQTYGYDSLGNLTSQLRTSPGGGNTETYSYDVLQRLKSATRSGSTAVQYDYTPSGNIKFKTDYSAASASAYSYGSSCGPHGVTRVTLGGGGSDTYTCDANGNVIGGVYTATFDANDQPRTIGRTFTPPGVKACVRADTLFCDGFDPPTEARRPAETRAFFVLHGRRGWVAYSTFEYRTDASCR